MIIGFLTVLLMYARGGYFLFNYTDSIGSNYSPDEMPASYLNTLSAFNHLFTLAFGSFFDVSLVHLCIRSYFCNQHTAQRHSNNPMNKELAIWLNEMDIYSLIDCELLMVRYEILRYLFPWRAN